MQGQFVVDVLEKVFRILDAIVYGARAFITILFTNVETLIDGLIPVEIPEWLENILNPLGRVISFFGVGDLTLLELMFSIGIPFLVAWWLIKFLLPTS